ncbi:MAG: SGNH/GDSL hydrolase family protein [Deltaproteobacteria bacterium]|nr:SGNH/GDSL hydrolase family protein [Deltaproteobacteria bacterium]
MKRAALALILALGVTGRVGAEPIELTAAVQDHVREIHARNPDLRDDAFSKMGGSSVASKAFLYCFATPYVDLAEHQHLAGTVDYFKTGRHSSFNRESEAAGVSWNLRYVLGGRPANFRQELEDTQARWAFVLFGGNDAQNENERVYLTRLVYLIEQLEEMGVVPVLGSALPRRNAYRDRWIRRFNAVTEAVAKHWELPYIDYHAAMATLPRKGLARDGVHPNVLGQGGVRAACQLTEKGLRYGNNVRNLLTLEMLEALRTTIAGAGTDTHTDAGTHTGAGTDTGTDAGTHTDTDAGTDADAGTDPFPLSTLVPKPDLPLADSLPKYCGVPKPNSRLYRTRLDVSERTRLRASALDLDGYKPRVLWVRVNDEGERCVRRRTQTLEVDVQPGMWDLIVEVPERAAQDGQMLILITRNPR